MYRAMSQRVPKQISIQMTEELINQYASVSNDYNPIHTSTEAATKAGFPKKVAHGMLTMAITSRFVSPIIGEQWMIQSFQTKFIAPVFINDTLTISNSITFINENELVIKINGVNQYGKRVTRGKLTAVKR